MRKAKRAAIVAIALVLAAGVLIYSVRRSGSPPAIVGVVSFEDPPCITVPVRGDASSVTAPITGEFGAAVSMVTWKA